MNPGLDLIGRKIGVYRVEALIGAGGYSRVYRAVDPIIERQAAIKILFPSQGQEKYSSAEVQRFEREAKIVANLRDPRSVVLYEYGQTDDGLLYMIFEFIEGQTLEEVRRQQYALPTLRAIKILEQILLSLEEAHAMGLIHRDIKPANIMVFEHIGRTDQVKVLDFGVGKSIGAASDEHQLTQTGTLIGTPRYMAPEQWSSGGEVSAHTDIYSLGLVAYELLTGTRAITDTEPVHIMKAHLDEHPIELPADLDIPSGLRQVVNTMLQKPLDRRYKSVTEVLEDLTYLKAPRPPLQSRSAGATPPPTALGDPTEILAGAATLPMTAVPAQIIPISDHTSVTTAWETASDGGDDSDDSDDSDGGDDSDAGDSGDDNAPAPGPPPNLSIGLNDPTNISDLGQLQKTRDTDGTGRERSHRALWVAGLIGLGVCVIGGVAIVTLSSPPTPSQPPADPGALNAAQPETIPTPMDEADFPAAMPVTKKLPANISPSEKQKNDAQKAEFDPKTSASAQNPAKLLAPTRAAPPPGWTRNKSDAMPDKQPPQDLVKNAPEEQAADEPSPEDVSKPTQSEEAGAPTGSARQKPRREEVSRRPKLKIWGIE